MRHSPLATLALAIASLVPATLFARNHPTKIALPARHATAHNLYPAHAQHSQPATFRPSSRASSSRQHRNQPSSRSPRKSEGNRSSRIRLSGRSSIARQIPWADRHVRGDALPRHSRRSTRRELLAATSTHHIRSASAPRRSIDTDPTSIGSASSQEMTSVVSVIRPTADHPQLPSIQQAATGSILLPNLYNDQGRLIVPAALVGSHEILVRQNVLADQDGLGRIQDDADLDGMRARGMLVPLPAGDTLRVDDRLPSNRRYCRTWTGQFLANLSRDFYARFHTPLQVNSAVRTVAFQLRLQRTNGNAAPAEGDTASPHLTGQAIDIAKRGLTLPEIAWLRGYLLPLIQEGRVDVEEEFQQSCFHISVYRRYLPPEIVPQRYAVASRSTPALDAITP